MGLFFRRRREPQPLPTAMIPVARNAQRGILGSWPLKARILIGIPLLMGSGAAALVAGLLVYYTVAFPDPFSFRRTERTPVIRILAMDDNVISERGGVNDYIPLDLVPPLVVDAVVATEDRRFNDHFGLDPVGLVRAALANIRAGRFAQGGSTITQQLAKNLFLSSERTLMRKLEELVLAIWLEVRLTKSEILELYLNRVYFGGGAYGIEAAAQRYFDKSARELDIAEAAILAGLLKAPSKYSPASNPEAARSRGRVVLTKMREFGVITQDQESRAYVENVEFKSRKDRELASNIDYAVDYILEQLPPVVESGYPEVIVETTIDPSLQLKAAETLQRSLIMQGSVLGASQGAITVLDHEGRILALVGGRSYAESQFNRAIKAKRQPGSAFKPFVYLAALEAGYTPDSVVDDLPINLKGWQPKNDNGRYSGAVTLRHALAQSINTAAVRLILDAGPRRVASTAERLGIASQLRPEASLALGTSEVSLLELTGAYTAFANGGHTVEPHIIRRVRLGNGRVLYARRALNADASIAPGRVAAMNGMLYGVMTNGSGRRAAIPGHPAAGKTGTSQEFRDAWFVGFTAHMTAGVWIGNDNGAPMNKVRGGQLPAEIWRDVMRFAHTNKVPMALAGLEAGPFLHGDPAEAPVAAVSSSPMREPAPWPQPATVSAQRQSDRATDESAKPTHPKERINDDFIARVLGETGNPQAGPAENIVSVGTNEVRDGRIIVRPPPGIMSLGAGPGDAAGDTRSSCSFFGLFC